MRVKAGPSVAPGTLAIEPDLAESWSQANDATWLFKLRKDVRWHSKPPARGRELSAEDVKDTFERAMTVTGNPTRSAVDDIERVDAVDRHTVRFTTKEPYAWFLDVGAQLSIIERYEPNVCAVYVRNPDYFVPGLPYAAGVDMTIDPGPASRFAGWMSGPLRLRSRGRYGRAPH